MLKNRIIPCLDVKNGLVSIKGAQEDYGVVFADEESL